MSEDVYDRAFRVTSERDALGQAIVDAVEKVGIINGEQGIDGPHLIQFCGDMAEELVRLRAIETAAIVYRETRAAYVQRLPGSSPLRISKASEALFALLPPVETAPAIAAPNQRYYLISLSRSKVARCAVFWGPDARGYSRRLNDAGDFTDRQIAKYADGDSLAIPCGAVHIVATNNMVSSEHLDDLKAKAVKPGSTS